MSQWFWTVSFFGCFRWQCFVALAESYSKHPHYTIREFQLKRNLVRWLRFQLGHSINRRTIEQLLILIPIKSKDYDSPRKQSDGLE